MRREAGGSRGAGAGAPYLERGGRRSRSCSLGLAAGPALRPPRVRARPRPGGGGTPDGCCPAAAAARSSPHRSLWAQPLPCHSSFASSRSHLCSVSSVFGGKDAGQRIPERQKSGQRFPWLLFLSYLCNRACMTLPADCLDFSSCNFHIPATPGRNLHPRPLFDVEMLWVPLSSIVQVFPEGKSGRFADVFLSTLSLQDLLAVFGDRQRWLFLWGNSDLQNLGQGKLLRECGYQQRLH